MDQRNLDRAIDAATRAVIEARAQYGDEHQAARQTLIEHGFSPYSHLVARTLANARGKDRPAPDAAPSPWRGTSNTERQRIHQMLNG